VCCSELQTYVCIYTSRVAGKRVQNMLHCVAECRRVLQCVAVCCSELQTYVWIYTSRIAGKCVTNALNCVAACCSVLQWVPVICMDIYTSRVPEMCTSQICCSVP